MKQQIWKSYGSVDAVIKTLLSPSDTGEMSLHRAVVQFSGTCTKDFDFESQLVLLSWAVNFQVIKLKTERVQKYFQAGFVFIRQSVLEIAGGGYYWLWVVIVNNTSLLIRFEQPPPVSVYWLANWPQKSLIQEGFVFTVQTLQTKGFRACRECLSQGKRVCSCSLKNST